MESTESGITQKRKMITKVEELKQQFKKGKITQDELISQICELYHVEDYGSKINYSLAVKKYQPEKKAAIVSDIFSTVLYIIGEDGIDAEKIEEIRQSVSAKSYIDDETWDMVEKAFRGVVVGVNAAVAADYYGNVGKVEGGLNSIIKNGKVSVDDLKANPSVFSGKSADEIAQTLTDAGYDVTIQKSARSKSGAQIIKINNPGGGKNISQVQVSPGGGRHGGNPYVKISTTDQGIIKIVNGSESLYKTDGKETATIIFSGGK